MKLKTGVFLLYIVLIISNKPKRLIMKNLALLVALVLILSGCDKNEHGPYNHLDYIPEVSAEINNNNFNPHQITTSSGIEDDSFIGIIARDDNYVINITFPEDCGETTFTFPNNNENLTLSLNNIECYKGELIITKYDNNMVRGQFEFSINDNGTTYEIKNGSFFIVYRIDY